MRTSLKHFIRSDCFCAFLHMSPSGKVWPLCEGLWCSHHCCVLPPTSSLPAEQADVRRERDLFDYRLAFRADFGMLVWQDGYIWMDWFSIPQHSLEAQHGQQRDLDGTPKWDAMPSLATQDKAMFEHELKALQLNCRFCGRLLSQSG